ncbi:hypothetical protein KZX46_10840 [Polymorphobacter sp. PAMC 29334]|uniref:hypothetical protein n=1 Tax=Polymorphobacter sp. PAMC 29334 TaxID=2862331 RepID=UPI001C79059E|nr:hypothetical protein [Polymorphobacter sp. PAMC 29334]QYE36369.1 hypothetical protein KZX46_10840 [Polymorphobacter sp. PAMC 29334]
MVTAAPETQTAGLRGAYWDPERVPEGVRLSVHPLILHDGQVVSAYLYARGGESIAAVIAHPREHLVAYYLAAELARLGVAVLMPAPRTVGNDIRLEHETAIADLAASMNFLRQAGYRHIVQVGNSGGGPLFAFYNQQALLAPDKRISHTPAGKPIRLAEVDLIPADGMVFVSAHLGQGRLLMNCIDPSVADEAKALSTDPLLDPFSPANGFSGKGAAYPPEFISRYHQAQVARVRRLDAMARELVAERAAARKRATGQPSTADRRIAAHTPIFEIWRTDADLRCWDLSIDPSDRVLGSLWGANPAASNLGSVGFARICTADSWLSTWSGLSSNASMEACAPLIEQPTLMIEYSGDASTFPADNDALFGWIGTADKRRHSFPGDHHGRPIRPGEPSARPLAGAAIGEWLAEKFPA